jgi:hypothetical protein
MTIAPPSSQLNLLTVAPSWQITKNAQARNAYGTVAQEIVCAALGLLPIPINGRYDCCFDAARGDTFYEIKSVRAGGKVVIYDWRMQKEERAEVDLHYAILCHRVRGSDGRELVSAFAASGLTLLVLPATLVHAEARVCPLARMLKETPKSANAGYARKGYCDGYRNVPVAKLIELTRAPVPLPVRYAEFEFDVQLRMAL